MDEHERVVSKKTDQISVRLPAETMTALREIGDRHGILPTEFTRRLIEAAVGFYREQGWFSFPVTIRPEGSRQGPGSKKESTAAKGKSR